MLFRAFSSWNIFSVEFQRSKHLYRMKFSVIKVILLSIFGLTIIIQTFAYQEVSITDGRPIVANDTKFINFDNLRVRKVNKTHHLIVGTVEIFRDISNKFKIANFLYRKAGNAYKKTPYHIGPKNACDFIREEQYLYPALLKVSDLPPQNQSCPIPKKVYHIKGYNIPLESFPKSFDGDFMIEALLLDADENVLNGYRMFASFIYVSSEEV